MALPGVGGINRLIRLSRALPVMAFMFSAVTTVASAAGSCESEMANAAATYQIPLSVLYAVGMTETGRRASLQPFAMNIEGRAYFAADLDDAVRHFDQVYAAGARLIDVGCMQIDYYYHSRDFHSLQDMFDPSETVEYAARLLKSLRAQENSWTLAVARYHAGPTKNVEQKQYVCSVITNMVATGFGAWTPAARAFCH
jgi:soluble lytic murein transglycosylase-like protein